MNTVRQFMLSLWSRTIIILTITTMAGMGSAWAAEQPECSEWDGILISENVFFMDTDLVPGEQKALLDAGDEFGPFWIQAIVENQKLSFENMTPGVGLPFTVYHVQVNWIDRNGKIIENEIQSLPASGKCSPLSLFPGQLSGEIELERPKTEQQLRMQLKVWVSTR